MSIKRPRLHTLVVLILLCMGGLALALVGTSFWMFRTVAYENRSEAVRDLLEAQSDNMLSEMIKDQSILGLRLTRSDRFRQFWQQRNVSGLERQLETIIEEGPEAASGLPLVQLRVLTGDMVPFATTGDSSVSQGCSGVLASAQGEAAPTRTISSICLLETRVSSSVLIPIIERGSAVGYIEVVGDPVRVLERIADRPELAVRIERPGGRMLYETHNWPAWSASDNVLLVDYLARGQGGDPLFTIRAATGITQLNRQLTDMRDFVLFMGAMVAAAAVFVALVLVRRLLRPLRDLQGAAERISEGGVNALDVEPVEERGSEEIATPIRSFNNMVRRLKVLMIQSGQETGRRREDRRRGESDPSRIPPGGDRRRN